MTTDARHPLLTDAFARLPRVVDLLAARAQEHDRDAGFPYQGIEAVHEAGLLTLTVSERYGGAGCGLADTVRVLTELGRGDPSVALVSALTLLTHAQQARAPYWPEAVYADLLADSVRGPALVGVLLGPEDPGGPGTEPQTTARRDGTDWRLTGRKPGVAGAEALAWMVVSARVEVEAGAVDGGRADGDGADAERTDGIGLFLVQGDTPGVQIEPTWDQLGLRATASHDVLFDGVVVGADAVVGVPSPVLDPSWLELALPAVYLGVARAARDWITAVLRPTAPDGQLLAALGRIETDLVTAEELLLSLARRVDEGDPAAPSRTAAGRIVATRAAVGVVEQAVALSGGAGLSRAHPLERHLRDVLHARGHGPREHDLLAEAGRQALRGK